MPPLQPLPPPPPSPVPKSTRSSLSALSRQWEPRLRPVSHPPPPVPKPTGTPLSSLEQRWQPRPSSASPARCDGHPPPPVPKPTGTPLSSLEQRWQPRPSSASPARVDGHPSAPVPKPTGTPLSSLEQRWQPRPSSASPARCDGHPPPPVPKPTGTPLSSLEQRWQPRPSSASPARVDGHPSAPVPKPTGTPLSSVEQRWQPRPSSASPARCDGLGFPAVQPAPPVSHPPPPVLKATGTPLSFFEQRWQPRPSLASPARPMYVPNKPLTFSLDEPLPVWTDDSKLRARESSIALQCNPRSRPMPAAQSRPSQSSPLPSNRVGMPFSSHLPPPLPKPTATPPSVTKPPKNQPRVVTAQQWSDADGPTHMQQFAEWLNLNLKVSNARHPSNLEIRGLNPWDSKTLLLSEGTMLASKLHFVPDAIAGDAAANRIPFGGLHVLKNLTKSAKARDVKLFWALELLSIRQHDFTEATAALYDYISSCSEPAHPLVLVAMARLVHHDEDAGSLCLDLLRMFRNFFPKAAPIWLTREEISMMTQKKSTRRKRSKPADSTNKSAQACSILNDWERIKKKHKVRSAAMDELLKLVGLRKVKQAALNLFTNAMALQQMPNDKRSKNVMAFNYCFVGNPGTGKTTVARLFARILQDSGIRGESTFVECTAQILKDEGADAFRDKLNEASDGVLFIDEAYELDPVGDFKGKSIVAELLTASEDKRGELSIILAGYEEDIQQKLYAYNDGLSSRFIQVSFEDFDLKELEEVWNALAREREWEFEPAIATVACRRLANASGRKGFGNARAVRQRFENAVQAAMARPDFKGVMRFTTADILGECPSLNPKLRVVIDEINGRIGWKKIKEEVTKLVHISDQNYKLELKGLPRVPVALNRLFLGNPGTGKTTFAAYYGRVLKALCFLSNGDLLMKTASDLLGSHVGESQKKTAELLKMAHGKVLVIDEAYNLNDNLYGKQALDTLVEKVHGTESDDIAVILIGYEHQMQEMLRTQNPGLKRRFPLKHAFHFEDYSQTELFNLIELNCSKISVQCPIDVAEEMHKELMRLKVQPNFGNAGTVEQLIKNAVQNASLRSMAGGKIALTVKDVLSESKASPNDPLSALSGLYRVDAIKQQLVRLRNEMRVAHQEGLQMPEVGHFVSRGSPGTGKTTVARVMAQILHDMGAVGTKNLIETTGRELTGEFVGTTKKKVTEAMDKARGGVLFIDEAYDLGKGSYGEEALTTLVAAMTDQMYRGSVIVIAGYPKDIDVMLNRNAGLKSRFTRFIDFEDWSEQDAVMFVRDNARKQQLRVTPAAATSLRRTFAALKSLKGFGNGRDASQVLKELVQCRAQRVVSAPESSTRAITVEDADMADKIILANRRPPDAQPLSTSATYNASEIRQRFAHEAAPRFKHEQSTRKTGDQKQQQTAKAWRKATASKPRNRVKRDAGVSDQDWAALERAKEAHAAHLAELQRLDNAKKQDEEQRKAEAIQERIRQICPCPAGFEWFQVGGGWRCAGGSHFVTDVELERNFTY